MKTSISQSIQLLEFMERYGDLSKPSVGPRGCQYIQEKWKELTELLNSDGTGTSRPEDKWRKGDEETAAEPSLNPLESEELNADVADSPPVVVVEDLQEELWEPPPKKKKQDDVAAMFIQSDETAREYARKRDLANEQLEKERLRLREEELRLRELELRERVRQRDVELQLQAKWLEFMQNCMKTVERFFERR